MAEFTTAQLVSALISILIATLFVKWAAGIVIDRGSFVQALLVAVVATLLASLLLAFIGGLVGIILAVVVWGLVAAAIFRTDWAKGALIGVVAWILWALVNWLIGLLFAAL